MESTFYFAVKQITIPTPSSFLSHHSLMVKWRCGKQKGKLPLVPLKGTVDATSKVPIITVELPPTARVSLVTTYACTTVALDIILVRHRDARREAEKARETIATHVPFDLGGIGTRLGIPQGGILGIGRLGKVTIEYGALKEGVAVSSASHQPDAVEEAGSKANAPTGPGGLVEVPVPPNGDVFTTADGVIMTGVANTPGIGAMASLYNVVNEGLFKASLFENAPGDAALALFFPPAAEQSIWSAFHMLREDEVPESPPWRTTVDRRCVYRTSHPRLRYGKNGSRLQAVEQCYVARVEDEYVARTIVYSNDVPVVGSGVKLDLVFHVASDGSGGSVIATFVHITASDMAKRLGGGMISKYTDKIAGKAIEALHGLLNARRLQGRDRGRKSYRNLKFRNSLVLSGASSALSTSLDPCLWRRLVSTDTLPNRDLVYQYLSRLLTIKVLRVNETQVTSLENVIGYHRESIPIVSAACNLLVLLCNASSFAVVHTFSPTLCSTIESVFLLHKAGTFGRYQELVSHLSRLRRRVQREQEELIARDGNVWSLLEGMVADSGLVEQCLRSASQRNQQLTYQNVMLLTKVVTLYMQHEGVVRNALHCIIKSNGSIPLLPSSTVEALLVGANTHNLGQEYIVVLSQLRKRSLALSHFEQRFGSLGERCAFKCDAWMTGPRISAIRLYLTASYLVIGTYVLPIDSIQRCIQYRSLTLREGVRIIMSANHDDYFVVLSRRRELLTLLDKQRVQIVPPLEGF